MVEQIRHYIEYVAVGFEIIGILAMILGALFAVWRYMFDKHHAGSSYRTFRHDLGKAILLGLEFLVAGDIIQTISVDFTMENMLTLGLIVIIRTFLSLSLQVELEGRWPWQRETLGK